MRHPKRCQECGSNFGHDEGCSHVGDAMKRDALLSDKDIPVEPMPLARLDEIPFDAKLEILRLRKELEYVEQKICKWAGITHGSVDWAELQVLHSRLHSKGCQPC